MVPVVIKMVTGVAKMKVNTCRALVTIALKINSTKFEKGMCKRIVTKHSS